MKSAWIILGVLFRCSLACLPFLQGFNPLDLLRCRSDEGLCPRDSTPYMYCGTADLTTIVDYGSRCRMEAAKCRAREEGREFREVQCFRPSVLCGTGCPAAYARTCAANHSAPAAPPLDYGNECVLGVRRCLAAREGHYLYMVACRSGGRGLALNAAPVGSLFSAASRLRGAWLGLAVRRGVTSDGGSRVGDGASGVDDGSSAVADGGSAVRDGDSRMSGASKEGDGGSRVGHGALGMDDGGATVGIGDSRLSEGTSREGEGAAKVADEGSRVDDGNSNVDHGGSRVNDRSLNIEDGGSRGDSTCETEGSTDGAKVNEKVDDIGRPTGGSSKDVSQTSDRQTEARSDQ